MKIARLQTAQGAQFATEKDGAWHHIVDPFQSPLSFTGEVTTAEQAKFLAPVKPAVVVGIGHNKGSNDHPLPIQAWQKSAHTVAATGDEITALRDGGSVFIEGELAVVIGKTAFKLTAENALDHVFGYTCVNDVTNVDRGIDERLFQAKSGRNYAPLGPWIETKIEDPENVTIDVKVNGEALPHTGTFNLPSTVVQCLQYVTEWMELQPGDIIMTGAPFTGAPVVPGDRVDITLSGIGTLSNTVV